jgi:hypothetical protein
MSYRAAIVTSPGLRPNNLDSACDRHSTPSCSFDQPDTRVRGSESRHMGHPIEIPPRSRFGKKSVETCLNETPVRASAAAPNMVPGSGLRDRSQPMDAGCCHRHTLFEIGFAPGFRKHNSILGSNGDGESRTPGARESTIEEGLEMLMKIPCSGLGARR